jgi:hypothetical protein
LVLQSAFEKRTLNSLNFLIWNHRTFICLHMVEIWLRPNDTLPFNQNAHAGADEERKGRWKSRKLIKWTCNGIKYQLSNLQNTVLKTEKLSFPKLENEFLENILRQLVNQHMSFRCFFTKQLLRVFIPASYWKKYGCWAATEQMGKSWLYQMMSILSILRLHIYSLGHPFIELPAFGSYLPK